MPVNRNALIRYRTLDKCLQNRYRKWTLEDLIDACSDALYEYEGIDKGISRRTIQLDIQMMRSDKLGYNAPIIVVDRKYYTYEDPDYSITNIPLTDQDLGKLTEAVEFLRQFKGFSHFKELDAMVQKLEDHVYSQKTNQKPVIDFEKNENLKGLEHLDVLYQAIIHKRVLNLTYQSFKARQANSFDFHSYLLKEFKNRWFLIGVRRKRDKLMNLALDRIISIEPSSTKYVEAPDFDASEYFKNVLGVTVAPDHPPEDVILYFNHLHAPYVLTKPLHSSQQLIEKDHYGIKIALKVQHNFELEKEILGFGDGVKVLAPERLRRVIRERLAEATEIYQTELSETGIKRLRQKVTYKGTGILNYVYTQRELKRLKSKLDKYFKNHGKPIFAQRQLLKEIPELGAILFNRNLKKIVEQIVPNAFCVKAIYIDKPPQSNWYVTWHQDVPINVSEKKEVKGYTSWTKKQGINSVCPPDEISKNVVTIRIHLDDTNEGNGALRVMPGSHKQRLSDEQIQLITQNGVPAYCNVGAGGNSCNETLTIAFFFKIKRSKAKESNSLGIQFDGIRWWLGMVRKERDKTKPFCFSLL